MENNLMAVMKIVHQHICEKSGNENLTNRNIDYEENAMDHEQACNTDSSTVTLASDDKAKVSQRSMLAENNAKNENNDEKNNLTFIENEIFKIQQFVK